MQQTKRGHSAGRPGLARWNRASFIESRFAADSRRREYVERLLERFVAPGGRLIICSYGSSRPEGARAELLVDELREWPLPVHRVDDVLNTTHGFVITRVVSVLQRATQR